MNELIALEEKMENALNKVHLCQVPGCTNQALPNTFNKGYRKTCSDECLDKLRHINAQKAPWRIKGYK